VWTASTISNAGDGVFLVALPLLAAALTRDPVSVSVVILASQLPWLLLSPFSGALVDRWDRKRVLWGTDLYRMVVVGLVGAAVVTHQITIPLLTLGAFLLALGEVLFDIASQSILPSLVTREHLQRANSRLYGAQAVTNNFLGGPIGGAMFALTMSAPFFADAASFGCSAVLVRGLPGGPYKPAHDQRPETTLWAEVRAGAAWLWQHRLLRTLAIETGVLNFCAAAFGAVFVLHAQQNLRVGSIGFGILMAAGGAGALLGSVFASRLGTAVPHGRLLFGVVAASGAALAVVGATSSAIVCGLVLAIRAAAVMVANVVMVSLRQAITPDGLLGRVNSVYQIPCMGALPLGAITGGVIASWLGLRAPILIGAAIVIVTAIAVSPVVNTRAILRAQSDAA
jgi:MFS family permease